MITVERIKGYCSACNVRDTIAKVSMSSSPPMARNQQWESFRLCDHCAGQLRNLLTVSGK